MNPSLSPRVSPLPSSSRKRGPNRGRRSSLGPRMREDDAAIARLLSPARRTKRLRAPGQDRRLVVIATEGNLLKGSATQVLQDLNLAFGLDALAGIPA